MLALAFVGKSQRLTHVVAPPFRKKSRLAHLLACKRSRLRFAVATNFLRVLCCEQAHAHYDTVGSGYYRQAYAAQAYCAAYVVAQKFGVDVSAFHFDKVCKACADMDALGKRSFISDVKRAAYAMGRDIQRGFRDLEQTIQTDGFSVEDKKAAREPKAKEDKEQAASR